MICGRGARTTHARADISRLNGRAPDPDLKMDTQASTRTMPEEYIVRDAYEIAREIGRGFYATVVELDYKYKGLRCVGKKIHKNLYEGQEDFHLRRFEEEYRMLSQLSHPHIVQFLGIYFEDGGTNAHAPVGISSHDTSSVSGQVRYHAK
jgi:serine/threonine protein kinase